MSLINNAAVACIIITDIDICLLNGDYRCHGEEDKAENPK
jgi:hypothetical protein